ncbi:2-succinyl-5-enolpyruvyl-6-hydroxy-3-cyclohexene-1-carboxylic-acid synthase [Lentibacillus sp. CBA3610]|uniref:2-succinyl-5-enolpyruvyl-6-hydroxy-3- cyclohexene-1-carboxylic-acid synthase n=1 Tax=Lentibacillus sp. CBA3610 TaxID=2518176 RepID=UPI001595F001|nr:2-succinyl-5-enolpyruvyl-6-hydroxy-3-cyclohexene-1-carboxylic-acid synthase [Lentibacillus sp. CBA3610]QKY69761.1 2-succinyl-5-enolpyruvyl-6-hydroxy-3-cyclohexene-1-carboxylic-acid synthase [Lentibacillus sp. CBA3610]
MNHTEKLTRFTANFVDELAASGLTDVVISPGSRSTPLAMLATEHPDLKEWIVIDERSAAFFALGMAKEKQKAVAIICTSGTAAANYFPAIVEAYYSRVPLVVLTADRPHELRDVGAPQSIGQIKLYGDYPKWFHEMALPEADDSMLAYARNKASRSIHTANTGNPGPVHLNFPFREPLMPDVSLENLWGKRNDKPFYTSVDGKRRLTQEQLEKLSSTLQSFQKGLVVCGPQIDKEFAAAVADFAAKWQLPILADPLSQVRAGQHHKDLVIESYDAILRSDAVRKQLKPDFIIRFGAMPVSKAYLFYVKVHQGIPQFVVENTSGYREPAGNQTEWIYADSTQLCRDLTNAPVSQTFDRNWLETWQTINQKAKRILLASDDTNALTEGEAVRCLLDVIPDESSIYVGNSMAVRDVDTFFMNTAKSIDVLANRGANGIDGMVSSGLGASAAGNPVTLLLGDLSFFHDMNGLLAAKHYGLNITIMVVNNNGGGIFSFLPQVNADHFEALFGTPLDIDFQQAVNMYGGMYQQPNDISGLRTALAESYHHDGLSVIEVKTERTANMEWHRDKWQAIEKSILE